MSTEEAFAIPLVLLNSADALRPQSLPPSHRVRARKIVAQIDCAGRGRRLPPKRHLVEMRQLSPDMCKTSSYGVQREGAIVLLAAKPLLSSCKPNLAILSDGRSRIMRSVVNSKCQHFLDPHATSKIVIGRFQRSHYCAVINRGEASIVLEPLENIGRRITTVYLRLEIA